MAADGQIKNLSYATSRMEHPLSHLRHYYWALKLNKKTLDKKKLKLIWGIIGIITVIFHMTYFVMNPYDMIYLFLGFGIIYIVFVLPLKHINKKAE